MKNITTLTGRLTRDAEIRYFESGKSKATFSLAIDSYIDKKKQTTFLNCEIWNKQAEFVSEYFKKGGIVTVTGELTRSFYNEKTYYTLKCNSAGFTNAQMVINGEIVATGDNKIEVLNGELHFEVNYYGKETLKGKHTVLLNLAMKESKPVFTFVSLID